MTSTHNEAIVPDLICFEREADLEEDYEVEELHPSWSSLILSTSKINSTDITKCSMENKPQPAERDEGAELQSYQTANIFSATKVDTADVGNGRSKASIQSYSEVDYDLEVEELHRSQSPVKLSSSNVNYPDMGNFESALPVKSKSQHDNSSDIRQTNSTLDCCPRKLEGTKTDYGDPFLVFDSCGIHCQLFDSRDTDLVSDQEVPVMNTQSLPRRNGMREIEDHSYALLPTSQTSTIVYESESQESVDSVQVSQESQEIQRVPNSCARDDIFFSHFIEE